MTIKLSIRPAVRKGFARTDEDSEKSTKICSEFTFLLKWTIMVERNPMKTLERKSRKKVAANGPAFSFICLVGILKCRVRR